MRMREARDQAGLTNRQLAERLARSTPQTPEWFSEIDTLRRNLRRWLRGHNKPSADVVIEYARICGVSPDYFHGHAPDDGIVAPLMRALEAIVDQRVHQQTSRLQELVHAIPDDVHPFDAVAQACRFARGQLIVASAEVEVGNVQAAESHLDAAIDRLGEALGRAKAAA